MTGLSCSVPAKLPAGAAHGPKKCSQNTFSHETIAIRLRLLRRPAGEIPGRKPGRIPPDGGQSCQGHHRTPHLQGDHRILRRKGPLHLQRHEGFPGPSVRQQGENGRRDRNLPAARTQPRAAPVGRTGGSGPQNPHRQQALLRRRRPAGSRGDRQHHFAGPHAPVPVRRLLRRVQSKPSSNWAKPRCPSGCAKRSSRKTPSATRPSSPSKEGAVAAPTAGMHFSKHLFEAHGDQGDRQGVHHAPRRPGQLPHGRCRRPLEAQDGLRTVLRGRTHGRNGKQDQTRRSTRSFRSARRSCERSKRPFRPAA